MLVSFRVIATLILAFFALCAYLRKPDQLSKEVRYDVDGLRDKKRPSITILAIFKHWEDASKKLKQECRKEAFDACGIIEGIFAASEAEFAAEDERVVKDGAMDDDVSHEERMQKPEQAAKNLAGTPPHVDEQRVQKSSTQEEVQSSSITNTEGSSKAAGGAQNGGVAEPASPIETDEVEDWSQNQIASAKGEWRKAAAAKVNAKKEDDARRSWEGKATRAGGMEGGRNAEEDWRRNQLERVAEGGIDLSRLCCRRKRHTRWELLRAVYR